MPGQMMNLFLAFLLFWANPHVTIKTTSPPAGITGSSYYVTLHATGGTAPYVWRLDSGVLPTGLTLASSGSISGTPSVVGASSFVVRATDIRGRYDTQGLTIRIDESAPPPPPAPPPSSLLWSAGMETGSLAEWYAPESGPSGNYGGGEYNSGTADSVASTDYAHTGLWSSKMAVNTTGGSSGTRLFRWLESHTYPALYYSVWYYIPQPFVPTQYWNLFQWKSRHSGVTDPFWVLNIGNRADGSMYFYLWDWQRKHQYDQALKSIPVAQWFHVVGFYQCAPDNTGRVMLWQDGLKLFDISGLSTRYADGDCQWSVDNYSNGITPSSATIYIDDAAESLSYIP